MSIIVMIAGEKLAFPFVINAPFVVYSGNLHCCYCLSVVEVTVQVPG